LTEQEDERYLVLKFSDSKRLKEFYKIFKEHESGELVKVGDDPDGRNMQKKKNKYRQESMWSDIGVPKYDKKNAEKTELI